MNISLKRTFSLLFDLRNCMVEREGSIRIADLAMACEQYQDDYCPTPNGLAPLRWWSWESILSVCVSQPTFSENFNI